ncbi:hypothetical protein BIV25_40485 [Streptomyces sp. MUSC 14]|uniref:hypothetical protein n=1 Tax=Streptomyces sp. MUSC 14 TaxID=1354889 RepID=UPI0009101120|nr:hypothetical protein BIV25_40485 [Streptomyces sp. MUSC 14]
MSAGRGRFCLVLREVTEFAGKVYVNRPAIPVTVDVTGVAAVAVSLFTASGAAAGVAAPALEAASAPPGPIAAGAAEDWSLTTLPISSAGRLVVEQLGGFQSAGRRRR